MNHAAKLSTPLDRESTGNYAQGLNDALRPPNHPMTHNPFDTGWVGTRRDARSHIKEVIQECLSELLKAHIGSAVDLHAKGTV